MPDLYANITQVEHAVQDQLAGIMELRAADPTMREMLNAYLSDVRFSDGARVLEVGCGTGAVSRVVAAYQGVGEVVGADPSVIFLSKARELARAIPNLSFHQADARALPFEGSSFDVVVFHTSLCHIPDPEQVLAEASRVLSNDGRLAVFDGDYATTTVATGDCDPLQACAEAAMQLLIHDRWLVRRLPFLLREAGFAVESTRSYGLLQVAEPHYMLSIVDRGADALAAWGRISRDMANALKDEARRRIDKGIFFGHIAYASVVARRNLVTQ